MAFLDKLSQRGLKRMGIDQPAGQTLQPPSPLPSITQTLPPAIPPAIPARSLAPASQRLNALPQQGNLQSTFQGGAVQKRFIADLPASMQLQGIASILSGKETTNPQLNEFVKSQAAQGKQPEEIRQAFIAHQKTSPDPLVIM